MDSRISVFLVARTTGIGTVLVQYSWVPYSYNSYRYLYVTLATLTNTLRTIQFMLNIIMVYNVLVLYKHSTGMYRYIIVYTGAYSYR